MFKEISTIEKKEKTREELLEEFKSSLEKYGVEGVEIRMEGNSLIIEQKYEEGIRGLGRSNSSVWMCLDQKDLKSFKENQKSNANTILDLEREYQGIIFADIEENEKGETRMKIRIAADHLVVVSANLFGKNEEVYLPGDFNGWNAPDPLEFNEETGELEGEIVWNKNRLAECKIAIHIKSKFDDGGWKDEANQKMEINLGEEGAEDSK